MQPTVKFIKLLDNAVTPQYMTPGSAGADLYSACDTVIPPQDVKLVHTGLSVEIPEGYEAQVRPRSGMALRYYGYDVANSPGTIDSDYRGEVCVLIRNINDEPLIISEGDRIAQLVVSPVTMALFKEEELTATERGAGGFGSTGR